MSFGSLVSTTFQRQAGATPQSKQSITQKIAVEDTQLRKTIASVESGLKISQIEVLNNAGAQGEWASFNFVTSDGTQSNGWAHLVNSRWKLFWGVGMDAASAPASLPSSILKALNASPLCKAKPKFTLNFAGCNLTGRDWKGLNLSGDNLFFANLTGANLSKSNLSNVNLSNVNFAGANLKSADLSGANLEYASLPRADLEHANLSNAILNNAMLLDANLSGANLSGATLSGPNIYGQNQINLSAADAQGTKLSKVITNSSTICADDIQGPCNGPGLASSLSVSWRVAAGADWSAVSSVCNGQQDPLGPAGGETTISQIQWDYHSSTLPGEEAGFSCRGNGYVLYYTLWYSSNEFQLEEPRINQVAKAVGQKIPYLVGKTWYVIFTPSAGSVDGNDVNFGTPLLKEVQQVLGGKLAIASDA